MGEKFYVLCNTKVCICFHLKLVDREKKNLFPTVLLPYYIPPILRQNESQFKTVLLWIQGGWRWTWWGAEQSYSRRASRRFPNYRVPFWPGLSLLTVHTQTQIHMYTNTRAAYISAHVFKHTNACTCIQAYMHKDTQGSCSLSTTAAKSILILTWYILKGGQKNKYDIIISSIFKILLEGTKFSNTKNWNYFMTSSFWSLRSN